MSDMIGCGDNSCTFRVLRAKGGMATNGGCQCFNHLLMVLKDGADVVTNRDDVAQVQRWTQALVAELRQARAALESERAISTAALAGEQRAIQQRDEARRLLAVDIEIHERTEREMRAQRDEARAEVERIVEASAARDAELSTARAEVERLDILADKYRVIAAGLMEERDEARAALKRWWPAVKDAAERQRAATTAQCVAAIRHSQQTTDQCRIEVESAGASTPLVTEET